eukprot:jgi/Psemu1/318486/estExt_fgenesh1_pm.C_790030
MNSGQTVCELCNHPGSDLRLVGCGCRIHARCIPLSLILDTQEGTKQHGESILPAANTSSHFPCPVCHSGIVNGIFIEPLCFNDVERAIALKKSEIQSQATNSNRYHPQLKQQNRKHARDEDMEIEAESPYLLLSNGKSSISCSGLSRGQQRTGRWTNEESVLVDFLVSTFDQGLLPLPHGIKLNEFLGDVLLCKSSRLTKKMKNAKLSTRTFVLGKPSAQFGRRDREQLSMLQESFLTSLSSESTSLTLQLNLTKQWRTHFYNVCLQIGYPYVQEKAWNASLQELEKRAARAEESVRRLRRRKMGLSSKYDIPTKTFVNPNPMFDFMKVEQAKSQLITTDHGTISSIVSNDQNTRSNSHASIVSHDQKPRTSSSAEEDVLNTNYDDERVSSTRQRALSTDISVSSVGYKKGRNRSFSEDFEQLLDVLTEDVEDDSNSLKGKAATSEKKQAVTSTPTSNFCKSLLDVIVTYIETHNLPFEHVDLWVPSFSSGDTSGHSKSIDVDQLHLHHAGHTCRRDVNDDLANMLHEFGVYSSYFSFEPGKGLPGRVYSTGVMSWESDVHLKDSNDFGRVEGAELYGIKTALAIPLNTAMVGRIVALMYSCESVPENIPLAREIASELTKYSLEPKWKLTIKSTQIPMVCFDHSSNVSSRSSFNGLQTTNYKHPVPTTSENSIRVVPHIEECREDHELASFLHDNMPPAANSMTEGPVSSSNDNKTLRPYFSSFRLLLLRPSNERTVRENEIIKILKKSFNSYVRDNRRNEKDLAKLIVKDWVCLKATFTLMTTQNEPTKPTSDFPVVKSMQHSHTESLSMHFYKGDTIKQDSERVLSSDFHRANNFSSAQVTDPVPEKLISDTSEIAPNLSSRSSDIPSPVSSSSKVVVDHTRYLPRKSTVDSLHCASEH